MVMKRKRMPVTRRNVRRRRMLPRRVPRMLRRNSLSIRRTFYASTWTWNTASVAGYWQYFQFEFSQIPNLVEYTGLFDEYKINAVKITFRPRYDSVSPQDLVIASPAPQAYLHYSIDPANTVVPAGVYNAATLNSFLEQQGVKTRTLNKPVSIYIRPQVISELVSNQSGAMMRPPWIRTSATAVAHRGAHVFIQQNNFSTTNQNIVLDVFYTYYMQLKNMR